MEFGRCCELLKVDVGADASSYTAGGTADSGNLVEWCNEVARGCRFCTHTHKQTQKTLTVPCAAVGVRQRRPTNDTGVGFRSRRLRPRSAYTQSSKYTRKLLAANAGTL